MKIIRFEIQIDEVDNVLREIEIKPSQTFKDLSDSILAAFNIKAERNAAFFTSNKKWQKLNEITLGKESKFEKPVNGLKTSIGKIFDETKSFVYFTEDAPHYTFIMVAEEKESKADPKKFPRITKSEGNLPTQRAKKFTDNIFTDDFSSQTGEVYDASDSDLHPEG